MKKKFRSFESARDFVRTLKIPSQTKWNQFSKSSKRPKNIPSLPSRTYKKEWISWPDWLGNKNIAHKDRTIKDFENARKYVRELKLETWHRWINYCKSGKRPIDIPTHPERTYKKEWISWPDWLGTDNIQNQKKEYRSFKQARKFVRSLKLTGQNGWNIYRKSGKRPIDIPSAPNKTYKKEWIDWGDWLGTGNKHPRDMEFLSFIKSRKIVRAIAKKYNLQTKEDFINAKKRGLIPDNIPASPWLVYSKKRKK